MKNNFRAFFMIVRSGISKIVTLSSLRGRQSLTRQSFCLIAGRLLPPCQTRGRNDGFGWRLAEGFCFHDNEKCSNHNYYQRGAVFIYIIIAIGLFAALSYAITRTSTNTGGAADETQAKLKAIEILSYANTVSEATSRVKLRGFADTELSFENPVIGANLNCADNYCKIFDQDGGGVVYKEPSSEWLADPLSTWSITGNNSVENMGDSANADLVLFLPNINLEICQQINEELGLGDDDPPAITANVGDFTDYFVGTYSVAPENLALSPSVESKSAACFQGDSANSNLLSGTYHFYMVLLAR